MMLVEWINKLLPIIRCHHCLMLNLNGLTLLRRLLNPCFLQLLLTYRWVSSCLGVQEYMILTSLICFSDSGTSVWRALICWNNSKIFICRFIFSLGTIYDVFNTRWGLINGILDSRSYDRYTRSTPSNSMVSDIPDKIWRNNKVV